MSIWTPTGYCLFLLAACIAAAPATAPATRPAAAVLIHRAVVQLGSTDPDAVAEATAALETVDPLDWPTVEAEVGAADVPPAAKAVLAALVDRQRSRFAGLAVEARRTAALWQWRERADLAAYHAGGRDDRRWNRDVVGGIIEYDLSHGMWLTPTVRRRINAAAGAKLATAMAAGCDDPTVAVVKALADEAAGAPAEVVRSELVPVAHASGDPRLMLIAEARAAEGRPTTGPATRPADAALVERMIAQLRRVVVVPGTPGDIVYQSGVAVMRTAAVVGVDDGVTFEAVRRVVEVGRSGGAAASELLGDHELAEATWAAGTDAMMSPADRQEVSDHLSAARAAYEGAWAADPTNHRVAVVLLRVLTVQRADRLTFDTWFRRAVATNPDDLTPYERKRAHLDPAYGGSPAELVLFGRQCLAVDNVVAGVPLEAVKVREQLCPRDPAGAEAYWCRDDVWADVSAAFDRTLAVYPKADRTRSSYAAWACRCSRWRAAVLLFDRLGDNADPAAFGGAAKLDEQRRTAKARI